MDIFRLGKSTKEIFEYVSDLLDGERSLLGDDETSSQASEYESRQDIGSLLDQMIKEPLMPKRGRTRTDLLFERLTPYYEAGFCFRRDPSTHGKWIVTGFFLYGKTFHPAEKQVSPFALPAVGKGAVIRGKSAPILKAFQLDRLTKLVDSNAFIFDVDSEHVFLLLSEKPFPWLEELVRETRMVLNTIVS